MDIKDLILIGGGLLVAAIIAHGLWIAWRVRRDPLRLKIDEKLIAAVAEREPVQADFPNGGARVVARWDEPVPQRTPARERGAGDRVPVEPAAPERRAPSLDGGMTRTDPVRVEPGFATAEPAGAPGAETPEAYEVEGAIEPEPEEQTVAEAAAREAAAAEGGLRERAAGPAARAAREPAIRATDPDLHKTRSEIRVGEAAGGKGEPRRPGVARRAQEAFNKAIGSRPMAKQPATGTTRGSGGAAASGGGPSVGSEAMPEDLILINLLAPREQPFTGPKLVDALRANGLRYGEMNIFHRLDQTTKAHQYSVANILEPGTFDMAEVDEFRTPGVCFFMRLPGPEHPVEAFEDMHRVARDVAQRLGGELKDERRSVLTGQTVEHYRNRVADFCRRRMSIRA